MSPSRRPFSVAALALGFFAFALGPPLLADDWAQWRGPDRNGHVDVFKAPAAWPAAPEQRWRVEVGEGYTSPVVVDGTIYLMARQGEDEVAMALDLATGKTLWRSSFPAPYVPHQAAVKYGKGPKATPVVADGVACFLGIDARFSCHDAESGKVLWVRDYSEKSAPEETFCG
ncbi:MAG: PQQ-binding-like beta-propeller repeat protein, partial [Acidobacteriota bacterium]